MRKRVWAAAAAVTVALATAGTTAAATGPDHAASNTDWTSAGQNIHGTRNAASEHILTRRNVKNLKPRWIYTAAGSVSATPTVAHGVTYVPDWGGQLSAVSTATGKALWSNPISRYSGVPGDTSRTSPAYADGTLVFGDGWLFAPTTAGAYIMGANAATGAPLWRTKVDDNPDAIITSSPVIDRGVAYVGVSSKSEVLPTQSTFRGSVVALSVATGKVLWKTRTVPLGYTGGSMWASTPVVDHETGLLYVDTGNNYSVPPGVCTKPFQTGCTPPSPDDHIDSILALHLKTGQIAWSRSTLSADSWTFPHPEGPDYDFGSGPNLYTTEVKGKRTRLLGAGQKSGVYWALDPATGRVVWQTRVGPGGIIGGIEFGTATDGKRVYVAIANSEHVPTTITSVTGQKSTVTSGFFAALDAATGKILWQTADPKGDSLLDLGPVSSANGVAYAGSTSGDMYALDGATGTVKWSFASGGPVAGGAAIVNGSVYWGSGYYVPGSINNKLYAFSLPHSPCDQDGTRNRCRAQ
ncbi:PQQ-binding-like beta-propeller repeat protein [Streptomyces camelliae]|uniref:PQQ-binding-like beta-propeller repeat protein n=1 Tax=Streptomyces camelliae TaxID=3004093 RepID=A0ABY7PHB9_9ACTN|nr:PQQ-binding-like beta-propeller repeat protein [Streptomyces sp. HUAS 2-6]WBO69615.1 PQQ-binding-like beta-propeller repeat protein [Streptomyces sp. HUAS 2-6]